jgi:hypothetical protein
MSSIPTDDRPAIRFETAVDIARAREDVFDYVAAPAHYPEWNSAVESVAPVLGSVGRYVMRRRLPSGAATNELEIAAAPPDALALRTLSGPTPFLYRYTFEPVDAGTRIRLVAEVELGGAAGVLGPLAARAVRRGVDANLATLRQILERGARK